MTFPFDPPDRFDEQERLYHTIGFRADEQDTYWNPDFDPTVHDAFYDFWYNDELTVYEREATYEALIQMLWEEYGINFEDLWDWDAFREWYDSV